VDEYPAGELIVDDDESVEELLMAADGPVARRPRNGVVAICAGIVLVAAVVALVVLLVNGLAGDGEHPGALSLLFGMLISGGGPIGY
jgi:hypothetical protein